MLIDGRSRHVGLTNHDLEQLRTVSGDKLDAVEHDTLLSHVGADNVLTVDPPLKVETDGRVRVHLDVIDLVPVAIGDVLPDD